MPAGRTVLARTETGQTYDTGLWRALAADLGCAGLLIPESSGGAGASYREAAVVAEETGRAVAPVPFLGRRSSRRRRCWPRATRNCSPPWPRHDNGGARRPVPGRLRGARAGADGPADGPAGDAGYRLTGTVAAVADALPADVLLVPADGVPYGLYAVRPTRPG